MQQRITSFQHTVRQNLRETQIQYEVKNSPLLVLPDCVIDNDSSDQL